MKTYSLYFDAACEPRNTGGWMVWAWSLREADQEIHWCSYAQPPGPQNTNNIAEYYGLGFGLRSIVELKLPAPCEFAIFGYSKLVVEQVNDRWACNKPHLRKLRDRCKALLADLNWELSWIPREQNHHCDLLCRKKYTEASGQPFPARLRP